MQSFAGVNSSPSASVSKLLMYTTLLWYKFMQTTNFLIQHFSLLSAKEIKV